MTKPQGGNGQVVSQKDFNQKMKEIIDLVDVGSMRVKGDMLNQELIIENKNGGANIAIKVNGPCLVIRTDYGELRVRRGKFKLHMTSEDEHDSKPTTPA